MQWKDVTSYSRDKPRVQNSWSLKITPDISVTVTRAHIYHPDKWVMHARPWYDTYPLGDDLDRDAVEAAQKRALAKLNGRVGELSSALQKIIYTDA